MPYVIPYPKARKIAKQEDEGWGDDAARLINEIFIFHSSSGGYSATFPSFGAFNASYSALIRFARSSRASFATSSSHPSPFIFFSFLFLSSKAIRISLRRSSPFSSAIGVPARLNSLRFYSFVRFLSWASFEIALPSRFSSSKDGKLGKSSRLSILLPVKINFSKKVNLQDL